MTVKLLKGNPVYTQRDDPAYKGPVKVGSFWIPPIYCDVGALSVSQFMLEEVIQTNIGNKASSRVSQFMLEEARIAPNSGVRISQFALMEVRESGEYV